MKTNKINVVLSLNKTFVSQFDNDWNEIIKASGAACGTGKTAKSTVKCAANDDKYSGERCWPLGTLI